MLSRLCSPWYRDEFFATHVFCHLKLFGGKESSTDVIWFVAIQFRCSNVEFSAVRFLELV